MTEDPPRPAPRLSVLDAVALIVGVVVGAGIFRLPPLVAGNTGSESLFLFAWLLGGVVSLVGALCYAELATAYPHAGGDYHYLRRAFGRLPSFLFAWARLAVIQTGAIAMVAFVVGDYASEVYSLGPHSSALYAGLVVAGLTAVNIAGIQQGKWTQNVLTGTILLGLVLVFVAGLTLSGAPAPAAPDGPRPEAAFGMAMVFVLLAYGGWNEAAYLSAEVRDGRRNIVRALLFSIGLITALYLLVNLAFLRGLGLPALSESSAVAADLLRRAVGERGAQGISLLIVVAALSTANATIFTGARTNYALGRDFSIFGFLGRWRARGSTPANALLVQGAIALALVAFAALGRREGFVQMVEYTAPVFWLFFFLVGVALFVLRRKEPGVERPFRVPLYPLTPFLFCAFCLYMLRSSLLYTGLGARVGVVVLLIGLPLYFLARRREPEPQSD